MIRIVSLVENTTTSPAYRCRHGLCLYVETKNHKILFDLGQDNLFAENAKKLRIDISEIDTVIISHGHKDHGGALKAFLSMNSKAKVYIRREAFEPHYIKVFQIPIYVGLDKELLLSNQIVITDEEMRIDEELCLFSNVKTEAPVSKSNRLLFVKREKGLEQDDFCHEQNLMITSGGENVLISGCSHAGIVNIQNKAERMASDKFGAVIGGFHLYNPPTRKYESDAIIDNVAGQLKKKESVYYTCHCTGKRAYERMKMILGDRLHYLSTGAELSIGEDCR